MYNGFKTKFKQNISHYLHIQEKTCNVAQYPLYHVTHAPAKFEVAMPKCLGGNAFTRNVTDGCTDRQTDRLWYEIKMPIFC